MQWLIPLLAWRPFIDPIILDDYWLFLLPPLIIVVSIVYKLIKLRDLSKLPRQSFILMAQIMVFMVLTAAALWLISEIA